MDVFFPAICLVFPVIPVCWWFINSAKLLVLFKIPIWKSGVPIKIKWLLC